MPANKKLFLSAVSSEFAEHRKLLATDLERPGLGIAVQEDFVTSGGTTLEKLDDYIRECTGVVHLIGRAAGAVPEEPAVATLLRRYPDLSKRVPFLAPLLAKRQLSYTQWEAYLALHHGRPLFVYVPADFANNGPTEPAQSQHYQRICSLGHDRGRFDSPEQLSSAVLRDLVQVLPELAATPDVAPTRLRHTAKCLIGRDDDLRRLDAAWKDPNKNVVVVRAFGGMGKTSLVTTWMAGLARKGWRGAERVFDWSFYSQGTSDQRSASADTFIAAALRAFGDPDPTLGSPWDRGARLAGLVGKVRCLLVLDGLEPLQYPPGPMAGRLKDPGVEALLKGLCERNKGLCVVTTREEVTDIQQHYGLVADDMELVALTALAGAALLHHYGARRAGARKIAPDDRDLQEASREVRGHGLTLQLIGQYLRLAEDGDVRKRDTLRLADADREYQNDVSRPYGHAFKAMEAYERWFEREGGREQRQLALLRLLGLFDRPASKECLELLRIQPAIVGLTEALVGLSEREWMVVVRRLEKLSLLVVHEGDSLDAHPLLREYFSQRLRKTQPKAWEAAHRRLFAYLSEATETGEGPNLEDLQPFYQAIAHGCQAGMREEACTVYRSRIQQGDEFYSAYKLGAFGSDLAAVACFFETPWRRVSPALTKATQAWLLGEAAFHLRALGRLTEAIEPMRVALSMGVRQNNLEEAARRASTLSELELVLGEVTRAVRDADRSVTYADRSGDRILRTAFRTTHADALHQAGRPGEAQARFHESIQIESRFELLFSLPGLPGFRYCDFLLAKPEREAGKVQQEAKDEELCSRCRHVAAQTAGAFNLVKDNLGISLLDRALHHLTVGRATLYAAILGRRRSRGMLPFSGSASVLSREERSAFATAASEIEISVSDFRRAGTQHFISHGLLSRAWVRSLKGPSIGPNSAQADLDEALEIAERGPMPLFLADIHLYRARLFFRESPYPWESPKHDLAEARRLIFKHGYLRRKEELEDAEAAILK